MIDNIRGWKGIINQALQEKYFLPKVLLIRGVARDDTRRFLS